MKLETTDDGVVAVPVFGESNLISTMINADRDGQGPAGQGRSLQGRDGLGEALLGVRLCKGKCTWKTFLWT